MYNPNSDGHILESKPNMQFQNPELSDEKQDLPAEDAVEETLSPSQDEATPAVDSESDEVSTTDATPQPEPEAELETVTEAEPEEAVATVETENTTATAAEEDDASEDTADEDQSVVEEEDDDDDDESTSATDTTDDDDEEDEEDADEDEPDIGVKRGELIEGQIIETAPTEIIVQLTEDVKGVINSRELEQLDRSTLEELKVGEQLLVYVLRIRKSDHQPILSINRAREEQDWLDAQRDSEEKNLYRGRIAGYNKGGLIVRYGCLRGFVPASQISPEREARADGQNPDERWSEMLNEEIMLKVVEVNRTRNRLILSERAADRERRELQKEMLISELKEGEIRTGTVISLTDFGAFVDLGGADGLIHLTELSWKHVNHPNELLEVGQELQVKVISVDAQRKRIGLSRKVLEEDPWREVLEAYNVGQLVQGRITKITRFGAFASLTDNTEVEGLIHVSELADYRVEHPRDVVAVGDVLTLRVIKIEPDRRRLGLSLRKVDSPKYMDFDWQSWDPET